MDTEDWKQFRKMGQNKRASNRQRSADLLAKEGIKFETKNFGAHLIVTHNNKTVDFWPGTGKFIFRDNGSYGRGVGNLIHRLKKEANDE